MNERVAGKRTRDEGAHVNTKDFRRIALSLEGAEEGSHMGAADFRVGENLLSTEGTFLGAGYI